MKSFYGKRHWLILLLVFAVLAETSKAQNEQIRLTAEKLQTEAETLFDKKTAEAREEAFPKFVEALKIRETLGDDLNRINILNKLNDISYYRSDFKQCLNYSSQLLPLAQKAGNKNLEGGVLSNIGFYHYFLGDSRKGLGFLTKSAEILNEIGAKQRVSIAYSNIGQLYYDLGEVKTALEYFESALKLKIETKDRRGESVILGNLGRVFDDAGEKQKAVEYFEKALKITEETKDFQTTGIMLNNLASTYQDLSEFQKSFDYYQKSLAIDRQLGNKYSEALTIQNTATLYREFGDFENSLTFLKQSLETFQKGGFKREEAQVLSSIGAIYSLSGDKLKALEFYQKGLEVQKSLDNKSGYPLILGNIGKIYLEKNDLLKSLEYFEQGFKFAEEASDAVATADMLVLLARNYEKLGKTQAAEANFMMAVATQRKMDLPSDLADALYYFAKFEENRGKRDSAIEKIGEVLQIVENLRSSIVSQNLRSGFLSEQQKYYDFYISLLVSRHKEFPDKGFGALALQVSEKARARSLLDTLSEARRGINTQISPEMLAEERILRQTINSKDYQRIEALKGKSAEKAAEFEKELAENLRKYQELQTKIRQANPQFASLSNTEPLNLKEIQTQILDEKSVLLEYFLGAERSFLFFVTKNDLEIIELPKRELLENPIRQTIENLKSRALEIPNETLPQRNLRIKKADAETEKMLAQISQTLISPIISKIENKRLLIVSSGILQYIPFAALTNNNSQKRFLIETNEIINLPSASVVPVLRQIKTREKNAKNTVTILADPVFSEDDMRVNILSNRKQNQNPTDNSAGIMRNALVLPPTLRSDFSRLRFSRTEADAISELAQSDQRFVALDFAANLKAATSENLQSSRIVHLATHGIVNSQFPELSSIVLSLIDEKGNPQEGFLRLTDVYNLRLNADLVVLSACETALGKEINGEGIIGLTRGFMYAGSPSVVASLWRVEDRATADLMKRFYQRMLREKLTPAAALREAQISMLKEKTSAHPFYWAGFTLQGDWR